MGTESGQADQPSLWNIRKASDYKYDAIVLTVVNAILVVLLIIQVRISLARSNVPASDARWLLPFVITTLPLLIPVTALGARRLTKKLISGAVYHKEIMWTLWYAMSYILFLCYFMAFFAVSELNP